MHASHTNTPAPVPALPVPPIPPDPWAPVQTDPTVLAPVSPAIDPWAPVLASPTSPVASPVLASPTSPTSPTSPVVGTDDPWAPVPTKPTSSFQDQELSQGPVSDFERFKTNAAAGLNGTLLGSAANYLAGKLAPDTRPIDPNTGAPLPGLTPREQVRQSVIEQNARAEMLPGWGATPEPADTRTPEEQNPLFSQSSLPYNPPLPARVTAGAAALAGSLAGGMLSPESMVAGPEASGAIRAGAPILRQIAKAAGVQAGVQGAANAAAQGVNVAAGTQENFDPREVVQSAGMGAAFGAVHPAITGAHVAAEGGAKVQIRGADGNLRPVDPALVAGRGENLLNREAPPPVPEAVPPAPTDGQAPAVPPAAPATDPNLATLTTSAGRKLDVRYEAVPADSLIAATGDLQPRERGDRAASDAQINSIAANLDPARLMRAPETDRGAPIVGPDHIVESGNGRVAAIRQAMQTHPEGYAAYVKAIQDAGHDTTGIENPVLVARRLTDLNPEDRIASIQEHNQSATAAMSAPEQAKIDGAKITSGMLSNYDHTQALTSAANRGFVRDWIGTIPEAERNAVQDAQGNLSAAGQRRLDGAMSARAYKDPNVLARGLESTDDTTRSITTGMSDAAPAWAKLQAGIEGGTIPPEFDTSKQLVQAADIVRTARGKKQSLSDILSQQDAFNPIDPTTEQFVRALYSPDGKRAASRQAVADVLKRYADEAGKQSTSPGLFGDSEPKVTPENALRAIVGRRDADLPGAGTGTQTSLLGGNGTKLVTPEPPKVEPRPRIDASPEAYAAARDAHEAALTQIDKITRKGTAEPPAGGALATQLEKLRATADAHAETMNRIAEARRLKVEPEKMAADSRPLEAHQGALPLDKGLDADRPPLGGSRPREDFNQGTSPYRQVFADACYDPNTATSLPIREQTNIVVNHVRDAFGFKALIVDPKQHPKEIRDQLSNFYYNAMDMANVLGMPYRGIGLDGRVTFTTKPYRTPKQALGTY